MFCIWQGPCAFIKHAIGVSRFMWLTRRGGVGRALTMWAARRYAGLTLREIGAALGGLAYAAVSMAVRRLEKKTANETGLRLAMRRITRMLMVQT